MRFKIIKTNCRIQATPSSINFRIYNINYTSFLNFKDVNAQKNVVLGLLKIGLLSPRGAYKYLPGLPKFRVPVH